MNEASDPGDQPGTDGTTYPDEDREEAAQPDEDREEAVEPDEDREEATEGDGEPAADRDHPDEGRHEPRADDDRALVDRGDEAAVRRMRTVAYLLDDSVPIPGTRFSVGIDPLLGVLPVSGDVVGAGLSLYIVAESARLGVSTPTLLRMLANVSLDLAAGSVPVAGTLFDAAWKANKRNLELALDELSVEATGTATVAPPS